MSQSNRVSISLLIVLLLATVPEAFSKTVGGESLPELDDAEMGAASVEAGAAWNALDKKIQDRFTNDYRNRRDRRELFDEYLETIGGAAILDYLELHNPRCHGKAHDLGNAIFAHTRDINVSLRICGNRCTNACMHGVVKEAFGSNSREGMMEVMNDFCQQGEMSRLHKPGNCAHGMGHALMLLSGHDIAESLAGCEGFTEPGMDYYCATGVFMEYRDMLKVQERIGKPVSRPGLHFPCDTNTEYPAACYRYMIRQIAQEISADRQMLIEECLGLPGNLRAGCFHGLGAMYSRRVADQPEIFPDLCRHGDRTDQILCIEGVIEKMADFNERHAMTVCAMLSGEHRAVCETGAREKMYRLDKPTMKLYRR